METPKVFTSEVVPVALVDDAQDKSPVEQKVAKKPSKEEEEEEFEQVEPQKKKDKVKETPERLERTIFVGNVSLNAMKNQKAFKALFSKFGAVESIRFRSIAFEKPLKAEHRKIGFISQKFHSERDFCHAYVVFKTKDCIETVIKELNGTLYEGKHLRIDSATADSGKVSRKKAVFVGNLKFDACEEDLWKLFEKCGQVTNVRIVRDSVTNLGKGFAYVEFKERACVPLALKLNESVINGRPIRVQKYEDPAKVQQKKASANSKLTTKEIHPALKRLKKKQVLKNKKSTSSSTASKTKPNKSKTKK